MYFEQLGYPQENDKSLYYSNVALIARNIKSAF
jgi:hypothetical protein